ncbi:hypothetical protein [Ekhidna sp.]|uniref:hypothetical protein n=1 Tax=Ekhidna sp. TaxID=2608089 RepID=UPI0032968E3F
MKNLKLIIPAIALLALAGCNKCNCEDDDFNLSHYYEPHITVIHNAEDSADHYYSVMLIVKNDSDVYEKRNNSTSNYYDVEFYFKPGKGTLLEEIKSYQINNDYELRIYKYPIETAMLKALRDTTTTNGMTPKDKAEELKFRAVVYDPPINHPHTHPVPLHQGTIHRPGVGGDGGGITE